MANNACARNNVRVIGAGRQPIVFLHGFGCDQTAWRLVAPAFESEFQTVLLDQVGSGGSDYSAYHPAKYSSLWGYSRDLIEVLRELRLHDVFFVGHSVSAMTGILAAIEAPELFRRLVLIGPSARYVNDDGYIGGFSAEDLRSMLDFLDANYVAWSRAMAPVIIANPDQPALAEELTSRFCAADEGIARRFARVTFESDHRQELRKVPKPSLVLQCSKDRVAPETAGQFIAAQIPDCTYQLMRATGHCPHLSAPEETVDAIRAFLGVS